jgi:hypothetical protein
MSTPSTALEYQNGSSGPPAEIFWLDRFNQPVDYSTGWTASAEVFTPGQASQITTTPTLNVPSGDGNLSSDVPSVGIDWVGTGLNALSVGRYELVVTLTNDGSGEAHVRALPLMIV